MPFIQFYEDIDIAAGLRFSPRHRTENGCMRNAEPPQFALMSSQDFQYVDELPDHIRR